MNNSPSTVQLLGHLGGKSSLISKEISVKEIPEEIQILLDTTTSTLSTVQLLRRVIRHYAYGKIGRELQHLSLTVASFERTLHSFIRDDVLQAPSMIYTPTESILPVIDFRENSTLRDIVLLIKKDKNIPVISGGIASLLLSASCSLKDVCKVLETLEKSYDPRKEARTPIMGMFFISLIIILARKLVKNKRMMNYIYSLLSQSKTAYLLTSSIGLFYLLQGCFYRFSILRKVKICHSRVLLILRLFILCQQVVQRARMARCGSQQLLIDSPCQADIDDNLKNATHLLVERVPLPDDYYNLDSNLGSSNRGLAIFKQGSHILCASSGVAYTLLGHNQWLWKTFRMPIFLSIIPYFILRPKRASRYATRLLIDNPRIEIIRQAWSALPDSVTAQWFVETFLAQKLTIRQGIYIDEAGKTAKSHFSDSGDIGVHIFSPFPLDLHLDGKNQKGKSTRKDRVNEPKPVLFYVHGGGFFGRFFAVDLFTLSQWASLLGVVIVYPQYGLSPEFSYPIPLEQCFTIYSWVAYGGLGFKPSKIAVFGESAGGNIAAAMIIKINQNKLRIPDGVLLMYPALSLHLSPSPSRFLHQNDPILPRGVLELALNSYYVSHGSDFQYRQNIHDPLVSPGSATNDILKLFPPTWLLVGGLDPLLDDSVDFSTRLRSVGVKGNLKIFRGITHGFLLCGALVPRAQEAIDYARSVVAHILDSNLKENNSLQ